MFHHVQWLTPGVVAFADELRDAGHTVHTPDLFGGATAASPRLLDEPVTSSSPRCGRDRPRRLQ
ncbi:MAG TPA: hypothetical protein VFD39_14320, partial [Trueperaceae bacterium]|nr:hypothetical protein [Trueperaceae bacterium]